MQTSPQPGEIGRPADNPRSLHQPPVVSPSFETPEAAYRRGYHRALSDAREAMEKAGCETKLRNMFADWLETVRKWSRRPTHYPANPAIPDPTPATGVERLERIELAARRQAVANVVFKGETARSPRRGP